MASLAHGCAAHGTRCQEARIGDAYQAKVPPLDADWVATASEARNDRRVLETEIWACEARAPKSLRRTRGCSTPGCALADGHLGPHSADAACEGTRSWRSPKRMKPSTRPVHRPKVYGFDVVGRRVRVYWPLEWNWYSGKVYAYDPLTDVHRVLYDDDDDTCECLADPTTEWALLE